MLVMRTLAIVALICLGACKEPAPMPEYAAAMKLYQDTVASTLDPSHMHADYAKVAAALRAVPKRNKREHARAQELAEMIERAQRERAALLAKAAQPLPEGAIAPRSTEPLTIDVPSPPRPPPPPEKDPQQLLADCLKESNRRLGQCIKACDDRCVVNDDGTFRCPVKSEEERQHIATCAQACPRETKCE